MARKLRSAKLDTRNARLKLPTQDGRPHFAPVATGIALGYRAGPGSWSVRFADGKGGKVLKSLQAIADDHEDADGDKVLSFWQATEKARRFARGQEVTPGALATVDAALTDYANDLRVRGGNPTNATQPRHHLTPSLLTTTVAMLRVRDLKSWRNSLVTKGMPASTVNRMCKSVKAALNLAASHDERITNRTAWTVGLAQIPEADDTESNLVLTDEQVRAVIASAYAISDELGLYVEVHAATGARSGQIAELNVGDLVIGSVPITKPSVRSTVTADAKPSLMMPSSLKGKGRRTRSRKPMPISAELAQRLANSNCCTMRQLKRADNEPLLLRNGGRWDSLAHRRPFMRVAEAAGLPEGATIYCLRHTVITRLLLAGVPVRLVASSLDTSVGQIEKTYSKNISSHGDDLMRRALLDVGAPAESNVVAMRR